MVSYNIEYKYSKYHCILYCFYLEFKRKNFDKRIPEPFLCSTRRSASVTWTAVRGSAAATAATKSSGKHF